MSTELGRPFEIDWRGDPPHMLKPDVPIWYRWLELYSGPIWKLYYDVSVGGPFLTEAEKLDKMKLMWRKLNAKRIDAFIETLTEVWIIEVSADPGLRSLGQLLTYQVLWIRDPVIRKPEKLILICDTIDNDLLDAAGTHSIQVYPV